MEKGEIFTFMAPNGVKVTAVVVDVVYNALNWVGHKSIITLCYAQNRLFTWKEEFFCRECKASEYGKVVVDYCSLPEYDALLKAEQQKGTEKH